LSEPEWLIPPHVSGDGLFASRSAEEQLSYALSATGSLSYSLTRIAYAENSAEQSYRDSVTAQIERDKVGIPKLHRRPPRSCNRCRPSNTRRVLVCR
jgi:hypothetical protein